MVGRRAGKSALDDDAVAVTGQTVAGRAENIEAFAPASQQANIDVRRFHGLFVPDRVTLGHRSLREWLGFDVVHKQTSFRVRAVAILPAHGMIAAPWQRGDHRDTDEQSTHHGSRTSVTQIALDSRIWRRSRLAASSHAPASRKK